MSFIHTFLVCCIAFAACAVEQTPPMPPDRNRIEWPDGDAPSQELVELGRILFFDTRLSSNQAISCASCHNPELGFSDGMAKGLGAHANRLGRNAPHLFNLAWSTILMWDGRKPTLEEQALGPISADAEMGMKLEDLEKRLNEVPAYQTAFKKLFPQDGITRLNVAKAIAAFERTIIVDDTPYDRWRKGDAAAMGPEAKRGLTVFMGKANCIACHSGPNFTDDSFHNLGTKDQSDPGRDAIAHGPNMKGAFKTPGLRNITLSAPYMHDGSEPTLETVVNFYDRGGDHPGVDPLIKPLHLTDEEKRDLIAFLGALTQPLDIKRPVVP